MDLIALHIQWMTDRGLSKTYIARRKKYLRTVSAVIGKPLWTAAEQDLLDWRSKLTQGPDTICNYVTQVKQFFRWLLVRGYRKTDPAAILEVPRRTKRRPRPIPDADLIAAFEAAPADLRLMLGLAGWAGLRCCEIASLRWESISLADSVLIVMGKGRREGVVPFDGHLAAEFRRYGRKSGWVIERLDGRPGPNAPYVISQRMNNYLRDRGLRHRAHSLRHRFGSRLLDECGNVRVVQEALRHQQITSTQIYTEVRTQSVAEAIAKLSWTA